jgi:hypothetical protein
MIELANQREKHLDIVLFEVCTLNDCQMKDMIGLVITSLCNVTPTLIRVGFFYKDFYYSILLMRYKVASKE